MKTSVEYLALSKRYRTARLGTRDAVARHQLEALERSYFLLAEGTQLLARSNAVREAIEKQGK